MINKISILVTIIFAALIIGIPTYINVKKDHEDKLLEVSKNQIIDASKKCFLDNVCKNNETSLKELYDNNYLEKQIDPKTKKYYSEDSKIYYKDKKIVIDFI